MCNNAHYIEQPAGFIYMFEDNNNMIQKSILGTIAKDQLKEFDLLKDTVQRTIFKDALSYSGSSAFVVKGVRRCGKSTLLKQIMKQKFGEEFLYFDFDDEIIISFKAEDFQSLMEVLIELFGDKKTVFFDEIQNITGWELFINRLLRQGYHVFITGSNANLLSKELGTHLTGRHTDLELYPFSFTEFLKAEKIEPKNKYYSTQEVALFSKKFKEYLTKGGMPEVIIFNNEEILTKVLKDIIQADIMQRYAIRSQTELRAVINFLITNSGNSITFRSIKDNFEISPNTVQKFIEYIEETYLIFTIRKYEKKIKLIDKNPRKVYCIDNGIITKNTPSMKEQYGALLENTVAINLKRLNKEFYYYSNRNQSETDFLIPKDKQAIQVCYELNEKNKERETKGLLAGMQELKTNHGLILTLNQEEEINISGKKISVKPTWKWLLEKEK